MPLTTKSAATVADKWARRAATATPDYQTGIQTPSRDWQAATTASAPLYKQAVVEAAGKGRFEKGVANAGTGTWQKNALEKGSVRWAPGIATAQPEFGTKIAEVLNTISSVSLPPRGVKGDPRNLQRVAAIADALHRKAQQ